MKNESPDRLLWKGRLRAEMNAAYEALGKLKWKRLLKGCEIVITHRGAPGDLKTIPGDSVTEVKKSYLMFTNERGEDTFIPLHRVMEIRREGKVLWKRESVK
jgi:uncharacterized protein (UPF0248 family)